MDGSSNNNSSNNNDRIYNLVWNNNYIRKIIFKYLNYYNILNNTTFYNIEELQQFKYKEYLVDVTLNFEVDLQLLPTNIQNLTLNYVKENSNEPLSIPSHIKSVNLTKIKSSQINSIYFKSICESTSNIHTLHIIANQENQNQNQNLNQNLNQNGNEQQQQEEQHQQQEQVIDYEIEPNIIPSSVKELIIEEVYTGKLKKNVLPNGLKKLSIKISKEFEDGCFPESLTSVEIDLLSQESTLILNQLSLNINLTKLIISKKFVEIIIDQNIKFSNGLKQLEVSCSSFRANLPNSLKRLKLLSETIDYPISFPSALEYLSVFIIRNNLGGQILNHQNIPKGLKTLKISCSSIVDDQIGLSYLPQGLETLVLNGNTKSLQFKNEIKENQLPSSLTYLSFGSKFNQIIKVNTLPNNLKTLRFGLSYNKIINPLALPPNLEVLELPGNYPHPINLSKTHPNTIIKCLNFNQYYQQFQSSPQDLRYLVLPEEFQNSLSSLGLQDKSNLVHLEFGHFYYGPQIQLSDLPTNNNIKTLEWGELFNDHVINLEHFKNLETIKINTKFTTSKIITSKDHNNNYNFYNLKQIIVPLSCDIIKSIDIEFYRFLNIKNKV